MIKTIKERNTLFTWHYTTALYLHNACLKKVSRRGTPGRCETSTLFCKSNMIEKNRFRYKLNME